jgi:flagellar hook assembly protein FlgD
MGVISSLQGPGSAVSIYSLDGPIGSWGGTNGNGDPVLNGVYHIKVDNVDPVGSVSSVTQQVIVARALTRFSVDVYNEAGEIVRHLYASLADPSTQPMLNARISGNILDEGGPAANGPASVITLALNNGTILDWDGRGDSGYWVSNGQYFLEIHTTNGAMNETQVYEVTVMGEGSSGSFAALPNRLDENQHSTLLKVDSSALTLQARIYDMAGQRVAILSGEKGTSQILWNTEGLASGLYLAELEARDSNGKFFGRKILKVMILR